MRKTDVPKNSVRGQFLGSSNSHIYWILKLKNKSSGIKMCVAFLLFKFWKELWRFKVKESMLFVEQNHLNFKSNESESKMENPTNNFREANSPIKSRSAMSWSLWKTKENIFCNVYFVRRNFFYHFFYLSA